MNKKDMTETFRKIHAMDVKGFNSNYRKGLGEAVSTQYSIYCETHPNKTREERKREYQKIHNSLVINYPSVHEIEGSK